MVILRSSFGGIKSARRLVFARPQKEQGVSSFYSRTAATRLPFQLVDMNELYIPSTPERLQMNDSWQPGDVIPTSASVQPASMPFSVPNQPLQANLMSEIRSMFQSMQSSIEKKL